MLGFMSNAGLLGINEDRLRLPPRLGRWGSTRNDKGRHDCRSEFKNSNEAEYQMDMLTRGYGWGGVRRGVTGAMTERW